MGKSLFRAFPWFQTVNVEEIFAMASPNWVEIENLNVEFWPFIRQLLKHIGSHLQIGQFKTTLPHLNARVPVTLEPEIVFPNNISLNIYFEAFHGKSPDLVSWVLVFIVKGMDMQKRIVQIYLDLQQLTLRFLR